jgi:hypothetical protein
MVNSVDSLVARILFFNQHLSLVFNKAILHRCTNPTIIDLLTI